MHRDRGLHRFRRRIVSNPIHFEEVLQLLDEPTTYRDLSHQLHILKLTVRLAREHRLAVCPRVVLVPLRCGFDDVPLSRYNAANDSYMGSR